MALLLTVFGWLTEKRTTHHFYQQSIAHDTNTYLMKDAKILLFDIETSPAKGYFFGNVWETNIIQVIEHSFLLSFAYKWLDEKKVHVRALPDIRGYKKDIHDDRKLVEELAKILEQADFIVGHNGDRFDLTVTNTRLIIHCLPPLSPVKTIDTLKIARSRFKFPSNKLDDVADVLGVGRKLAHTGKHLWLACMENTDPKAWGKMKKYNKQDVVLLERVYKRLRPFATTHPNVNVITRAPNACPACGSTALHKKGFRYNPTSERQMYRCYDCQKPCYGAWVKIASKVHIT